MNNTSDLALFKISDFTKWQETLEFRYPDGGSDITHAKQIFDWIISCGTDYNKFKAEISRYMEKEHIIFYWLFTFIFGMVDQRAKNMFLTIYQGKLWLFILYDNDTCIGINNEGEISFKYNIEVHDILGSKAVWNGADSALWNLVENAFPDEIREMYYKMRQQGYLTYDKLIEYLDTRQSEKWSEAIYNEDGYFKYEKPLIDGYLDYSQSIENPQIVKTGAYLYALQGSREMFRKWWLANRLNYLDSKYLAGSILSDTAVFRTYTPSEWTGVRPNADITVTAFASMYLNVKWGSVTKSQRVGFNETYKMIAPEGMQFNDTETILYGASLMSSLGDLSPLYVGSVDVSKMSRLKELIIGSAVQGYRNTNFTVMSVGNNTMLRKVDVQNCPNLTQPIDLTGCENLEEVYAQGTGLTAVLLPPAGILKKYHLPTTVANLTIKNQPQLTDAGLILDGVNNIATIVLENVVFNAFDLLKRCLATGKLQRIRCVGITGSAEIADILYQISQIGGIDENGYNIDRAVLTGNFHVSTIREDKFAELGELFPELTITYDTLTLLPAVTLSFTSSQNKPLLSTKFVCSSYYQKVDNTTFKVKGLIGDSFTFTFSALNHEDLTNEVTITQQEEMQDFSATYIPLRTIKILKRNTTIFVPSATVRIGDETFTASATGQVQIRKNLSLSGTVKATDYNDSEFSFDAIVDDTTNEVYLDPYAIVTFTVKDDKGSLLSGAKVTVGGKSANTNSSGICSIALKKGTYNYTAKYQSYIGIGEVVVDLLNISVQAKVTLDIPSMKPEENGNIQLMLIGPTGTLNITSATDDYRINWGDSTTMDNAKGVGAQNYIHNYQTDGYYQVEVINCNNVTSCNGSGDCLISYWSLGDSIVKNITFSDFRKLVYFGDVFKNDIERTSLSGVFYRCWSLEQIDLTCISHLINVTDVSYLLQGTFIKYVNLKPLHSLVNITNIKGLCYDCNSLKEVEGERFEGLKKVVFSDSVFKYCYSLEKSYLPEFTKIGEYYYEQCRVLKFVISTHLTPPTLSGSYIFYGSTPNIYVPDESLELYLTATNWLRYNDRIKPMSQFSADFPDETL